MTHRSIALLTASLFLLEISLPSTLSAFSQGAPPLPLFTIENLQKASEGNIEEFLENIQEVLAYEDPDVYRYRMGEIADIYAKFQDDPRSVPVKALSVLNRIFFQAQEDYVRDLQMVEINRLMYGVIEIGLAVWFTGTAVWGDKIKALRNRRYGSLKQDRMVILEQEIEVLQKRIVGIDEEIAARAPTLVSRPGDANYTEQARLAEELMRSVRERVRKGDWRGNKTLKKQMGKDKKTATQQRRAVYTDDGYRTQGTSEREQEKLLKQLEKKEKKEYDITTGRTDILPKQKRGNGFRLPTFSSLLDRVVGRGWLGLAGARRLSREAAPEGFLNNIDVLFRHIQKKLKEGAVSAQALDTSVPKLAGQKTADRLNIEGQWVAHFKGDDLQSFLNHYFATARNGRIPLGTALADLSPVELTRLYRWLKAKAQKFEISISKSGLKNSKEWAKIFLWDRLVWTGRIAGIPDIYPIVAGLGAAGVGTLWVKSKPEQWWFPSSGMVSWGRLRSEPMAMVEEIVGPGFWGQYEAHLELAAEQEATPAVLGNALTDQTDRLAEIQAERTDRELQHLTDLTKTYAAADALSTVGQKLGPEYMRNPTPYLPQPETGEDWSIELPADLDIFPGDTN